MTTREEDPTAWIQTHSGRQFFPLDPRPEDICIEDIAHALSNVCRWTGHVSEFFSVAQHSFLVSCYVPPEDALWGLLHDASEAYICDIARPLKRTPAFAPYREAEKRVMAAVCAKFGLSTEEPESVKIADRRMMYTEARDLMGRDRHAHWIEQDRARNVVVEPYASHVLAQSPESARRTFWDRFIELTKKPSWVRIVNS